MEGKGGSKGRKPYPNRNLSATSFCFLWKGGCPTQIPWQRLKMFMGKQNLKGMQLEGRWQGSKESDHMNKLL